MLYQDERAGSFFSPHMCHSLDLTNEFLQDDEAFVEPWSTMTLRRQEGHLFFLRSYVSALQKAISSVMMIHKAMTIVFSG